MNDELKKQIARRAPGLADRLGHVKRRLDRARARALPEWDVDGIRLPKDPDIINEKIAGAIVGGWYEKEEREHLPGLLRKGDVVLELGTGLGLVSTLCARDERVRHVVTVEANPALIPYARNVHRINGVADRVCQVHAIAMPAPTVEEMDFYVRDDVWASSLNGDVWGWQKKISTRVIDLNALVADLQPSLLIVDIEGGEDLLLDGFEPGTIRQVYMELHEQVIGGDGIRRIFDRLSELGFHYDPSHSAFGVVTFTKSDPKSLPRREKKRPPPKAFIGGRLVRDAQRVIVTQGERKGKPRWITVNVGLRATTHNNLVYGLNAKAACTTFLNFLVALEKSALPEDELAVHFDTPDDLLTWRVHREPVEDILLGPDPFLFTFVRDPYRRFLSGFFDKVAAESDQNYAGYRQMLREEWQLPEVVDEHNARATIDRFIDYLDHEMDEHNRLNVRDPHFNPQCWNINLAEINYDFIGQVENVREGLEEVMKHSRLKTDFGHLFERRFNETRSALYRDYALTAEQRERLRALYAVDFEHFGHWYDTP